MPKDEFDFDDPLELNGMALVTDEDTTDAMCECFIEEFLRMGYDANQILALFRNPFYTGMHMALEKRGEPFIRGFITEVFARWGKHVQWLNPLMRPQSPSSPPLEERNGLPSEVLLTKEGERRPSNLADNPTPDHSFHHSTKS
jgi:hypothetical protein